jgi:hypothetical protein
MLLRLPKNPRKRKMGKQGGKELLGVLGWPVFLVPKQELENEGRKNALYSMYTIQGKNYKQ